MEIEAKRRREQQIVAQMIGIYCHGKKHQREKGEDLCPSCRALVEYADQRVAHCPHMQEKTFCNFCKTHCYAPQKRAAIREAMRYAGPRMLFHAPFMALEHMFLQLLQRLKQ